jgi:hypothetical protein
MNSKLRKILSPSPDRSFVDRRYTKESVKATINSIQLLEKDLSYFNVH